MYIPLISPMKDPEASRERIQLPASFFRSVADRLFRSKGVSFEHILANFNPDQIPRLVFVLINEFANAIEKLGIHCPPGLFVLAWHISCAQGWDFLHNLDRFQDLVEELLNQADICVGIDDANVASFISGHALKDPDFLALLPDDAMSGTRMYQEILDAALNHDSIDTFQFLSEFLPILRNEQVRIVMCSRDVVGVLMNRLETGNVAEIPGILRRMIGADLA